MDPIFAPSDVLRHLRSGHDVPGAHTPRRSCLARKPPASSRPWARLIARDEGTDGDQGRQADHRRLDQFETGAGRHDRARGRQRVGPCHGPAPRSPCRRRCAGRRPPTTRRSPAVSTGPRHGLPPVRSKIFWADLKVSGRPATTAGRSERDRAPRHTEEQGGRRRPVGPTRRRALVMVSVRALGRAGGGHRGAGSRRRR